MLIFPLWSCHIGTNKCIPNDTPIAFRVPVTRLDPNFVPDVSLECTVAGVSGSASHLSTEREHRKLLESVARFSQGDRFA